MANAYFAADYGNNPPQVPAFQPVRRPFNVMVNATAGGSYGTQGYAPVSTLGSADTIALCTLPGQGSGIIITDWAMSLGVIDSGTHACVLELGLALGSLDPSMTSSAAAGFFATGITPGAAGGVVSAFGGGLSSTIVFGTTSGSVYTQGGTMFSISDYLPNLNGGLYDLVLQVTTAAGTVAPGTAAAYIRGYVEYIQVSQAWAN